MFKHEKQLFHPVAVERANPHYAALMQESGSNADFGTTKAAKMYFSMSNPGPNAFANNPVHAPKFAQQ